MAVGGTDSWYAGLRIDDIVALNPTHIFIEYAINDVSYTWLPNDRTNDWWPAAEALIRRLRTELPNAKLMFVCLTRQEEYTTQGYIDTRDNWLAICAKYDVPICRHDVWLQGVLGTTTPTLEQVALYHDGVHLTSLGYMEAYNMLLPHLPDFYSAAAQWTGDLNDYSPPIYDDVTDFEAAPILRNGTDNDGETGTGWSDNGTARRSSTVDDTISWTGTFSSFAVDVDAGTYTFAWSIDGGAFTNINQAPGVTTIRQLYAKTRGEHTVTIKIVSGTVEINRFLAI